MENYLPANLAGANPPALLGKHFCKIDSIKKDENDQRPYSIRELFFQWKFHRLRPLILPRPKR